VSQVPQGLPAKRRGIFMPSMQPVSESQSKLANINLEDEESDSGTEDGGDLNSSDIFTSDDEISEDELADELNESGLDEEGGKFKNKKTILGVSLNFSHFNLNLGLKEEKSRQKSIYELDAEKRLQKQT
jgi:hypothetical protein